ncbi:MAG: deoxyribodipyrimidine photo-lyase, partial [Chloroflexi bacterium]|nr:deoxyribodipyrimidine photo-lyase [Chloroflexota bacterium]
LMVLHGRPDEVLPALAAEIGAERIYAAADEDPVAINRDDRVATHLDLRLVDDQRIVAPRNLRTGTGSAYTVYTPFRRALDSMIDEARMPPPRAPIPISRNWHRGIQGTRSTLPKLRMTSRSPVRRLPTTGCASSCAPILTATETRETCLPLTPRLTSRRICGWVPSAFGPVGAP